MSNYRLFFSSVDMRNITETKCEIWNNHQLRKYIIPPYYHTVTDDFGPLNWRLINDQKLHHICVNTRPSLSTDSVTQHKQTNTGSRTIYSCQKLRSAPVELSVSPAPPGCSPKSHSSDGLHLPITGNHLQPHKSSEETFTAR